MAAVMDHMDLTKENMAHSETVIELVTSDSSPYATQGLKGVKGVKGAGSKRSVGTPGSAARDAPSASPHLSVSVHATDSAGNTALHIVAARYEVEERQRGARRGEEGRGGGSRRGKGGRGGPRRAEEEHVPGLVACTSMRRAANKGD